MNFPYPIDRRIAPKAPIAAASAGVAKPRSIEPKANEIKIVGGIKPAKNSSHKSENLNRSAASLWYIAKLKAPRKTANKNRTRDTQGILLPHEVKR